MIDFGYVTDSAFVVVLVLLLGLAWLFGDGRDCGCNQIAAKLGFYFLAFSRDSRPLLVPQTTKQITLRVSQHVPSKSPWSFLL